MSDSSFAAKTKLELCKRPLGRDCCADAELYGALLFANIFSFDELRLTTENEKFAERVTALATRCVGVKPEHSTLPGGKILLTAEGETAQKLYTHFGYETRGQSLHLNNAVVEDDCCREAFLRGAFLSAGSVNDPERSYHLEISTRHFSLSREMTALLIDMELEPKTTLRKSTYVVYFKESDLVADLLAKMGAGAASLAVHSALIEKEVRNDTNRRVNCDTANISKTVSAAQKQLAAIRKLRDSGALADLPEALREAARLREENPEASLEELASLAGVSRSGLNHRLARLLTLAG